MLTHTYSSRSHSNRAGLLSSLVTAALVSLATGAAAPPGDLRLIATAGSNPETWESGEHADSPVLDADATLNDYLLYAALNSEALRAAYEEVKAALLRIPQVKTLPDPMISYAYFLREVETRVGPQEQRLGLSQMFPWFGTLRLQGEIAAKQAEAAAAVYQQKKLDLFYKVKTVYYDYFYLHQAIRITRQNMELLTDIEEVAREAYKTGQPLAPLLQLQVELGKLDDRLRTLEAMREPVSAKLSASLSRPSYEVLPWPAAIPDETVSARVDQLTAEMPRYNPSLHRLDLTAQQHATAAELAGKSRWPNFTLGITYTQTADALMDNTPDNGKDPVMASISMNLPIWRGKYNAAEQEAWSRESAARATYRDAYHELSAELAFAVFQLEDADRKIKLYRDTLIPKGEQALNVARQAFEAGKVDFLSMIDAQRMLLEFQLAYEQARTEHAKRVAQIEKLTGHPLAPATPEEALKQGQVPEN